MVPKPGMQEKLSIVSNKELCYGDFKLYRAIVELSSCSVFSKRRRKSPLAGK